MVNKSFYFGDFELTNLIHKTPFGAGGREQACKVSELPGGKLVEVAGEGGRED